MSSCLVDLGVPEVICFAALFQPALLLDRVPYFNHIYGSLRLPVHMCLSGHNNAGLREILIYTVAALQPFTKRRGTSYL